MNDEHRKGEAEAAEQPAPAASAPTAADDPTRNDPAPAAADPAPTHATDELPDTQAISVAPDAVDAEADRAAPDEVAPETVSVAPEPAAAAAESADEAAPADGDAVDSPATTPAKADDIELLKFEDLALSDGLMKAIRDDLGFEHGTPIQSATLPWSLADYDVVGQAQTGTGKTAAFLITIFSRLWEQPEDEPPPLGRPRSLVLAPTRELALQIARDAEDLGRHLPFTVLAVVGGIDFDKQLSVLKGRPVDLIIATPGRLIDFIDRRAIDLGAVEVLVIDEADRMLDMGFIPDVRRIVYKTPHKRTRQTLFFSATFNDDVHRLADQWTIDPYKVVIAPESVAVDTVKQEMYNVAAEDKFTVLYNLIMSRDLTRVIVFSNRRDSTREIYQRLRALGVDCDTLAGDIPQRKRLATLDRFKAGNTRVLVATDVAGRGIHVDGISHVINYHLPEDPEDYVHRIGRTGRAGAEGASISLVCEDEGFKVEEIEKLLDRKLDFMHPPESMMRPVPTNRQRRRRAESSDDDATGGADDEPDGAAAVDVPDADQHAPTNDRTEARPDDDVPADAEPDIRTDDNAEVAESDVTEDDTSQPATAAGQDDVEETSVARRRRKSRSQQPQQPQLQPSHNPDSIAAAIAPLAGEFMGIDDDDEDLEAIDLKINGNVALPEDEEPDDDAIDAAVNGNVLRPPPRSGSSGGGGRRPASSSSSNATGADGRPRRRRRRRRTGRDGNGGGGNAGNSGNS